MQTIVINSFAFTAPDSATPGSVDVRTAADGDVAFNNFDDSTSFGNDWNMMYPLEITADSYANAVRWVLAIPQSATITSVQVTFYEGEGTGTHSAADSVETVGFEQVDNAGQITSKTNFETRYASLGTTSSFSMSSVPASTSLNDPLGPFVLPNSMIQELVDRAGWVSGNAVMLFMRTTGSDDNIAQWQAHATRTAAYTPRIQVAYVT